MLATLLTAAAALPAPIADLPHAPPARAYSAFHEDPARRFDFWIGRWHVDLRKRKEGMEWEPLEQATARVYPILGGKALLELWDSDGILGYSLRYYHPGDEAWHLWLDWPSPDNSRVNKLEGHFRHGRGVFEGGRQIPDGPTIISRFSFDDITPFSLRWEDAYSQDGGEKWNFNWIMEFTREALEPEWPIPHAGTPTLGDGERCPSEPFRAYEPLAGHWQGSSADGEAWKLDAWRIVGGCGLIGLLEGGGMERFLFMTWHSPAERYELHVLDDRPGTTLRRLTGTDGALFTDAAGRWDLTIGPMASEISIQPRDGAPTRISLEAVPAILPTQNPSIPPVPPG